MHKLYDNETIDFPIPLDIHTGKTLLIQPEYGTLVFNLLKFQPGLILSTKFIISTNPRVNMI